MNVKERKEKHWRILLLNLRINTMLWKIMDYMGLPGGIKAFFVLNAANLSDETERLTRATSELMPRKETLHLP